MRKFIITFVAAGTMGLPALAQNNGAQELTGPINVTRGIVQQLEDELARRSNQNPLSAEDYQKWNEHFRSQIDKARMNFEKRLQEEIVAKLQGPSDEYLQILKSYETKDEKGHSILREDQYNNLRAMKIADLQKVAEDLTPKYWEIYDDLVGRIFGWLPTLKVSNVEFRGNAHKFRNTLLIMGLAPGLWSLAAYESLAARAKCVIYYDYTISSVNGRGPSWKGKMAEPLEDDCKAVKKNFSPSSDPNAYFSKMSPKDFTQIMNQFVIPEVKSQCNTQACLALKEADLHFTLETISKQIDQPFIVKFKDEATVRIQNPGRATSAYLGYLQQRIGDSSLPFDIKPQ